MYVDDSDRKYPYYIGPPGSSYGDSADTLVVPPGVYWSTKLFPYYPLNWTNRAFHCPGYKGTILVWGATATIQLEVVLKVPALVIVEDCATNYFTSLGRPFRKIKSSLQVK
jgi:hypothetical protein